MTEKATYRVRNWKDYNESLVKRGNITLWMDEKVLQAWKNPVRMNGKRGRPEKYPAIVIECALTLRALFKQPLRATEGLLKSLTKLMGIVVEVPDYTTLCKRQKSLRLCLKRQVNSAEKLNIVMDSTGLKVYGEGEWKMRQHGKSKRRTWRKVHLAIESGSFEIVGAMVTEASCHDGEVMSVLLDR